MEHKRYKLVFQGEALEGADLRQVKANIGRLCKLEGPDLEHLFSGRRIQIRTNLDHQSALKYQAAFKKAGAVCYMLELAEDAITTQYSPETAVDDAEAEGADEAEWIDCPNCGFEQEAGPECIRCGIIFDKFAARQQADKVRRIEEIEKLKRNPTTAAVPMSERPAAVRRKSYLMAAYVIVPLVCLIVFGVYVHRRNQAAEEMRGRLEDQFVAAGEKLKLSAASKDDISESITGLERYIGIARALNDADPTGAEKLAVMTKVKAQVDRFNVVLREEWLRQRQDKIENDPSVPMGQEESRKALEATKMMVESRLGILKTAESEHEFALKEVKEKRVLYGYDIREVIIGLRRQLGPYW